MGWGGDGLGLLVCGQLRGLCVLGWGGGGAGGTCSQSVLSAGRGVGVGWEVDCGKWMWTVWMWTGSKGVCGQLGRVWMWAGE